MDPRGENSADPLHGITLEHILTQLLKRHGWGGLGRRIPVRCFLHEPAVKSSLAFLRKTPWARAKVERLYLSELPRRFAPAAAPADPCIISVARTVTGLLGVKEGLAPEAAPADPRVTALAPAGGVKKLLLYAPDAIGRNLVTKEPTTFACLDAEGFKRLALRSVYPSVTPVCFASMFSGLTPHGHGINSCEKPQLACRTIFDALPAAGLKAAIVAVKGSSIDLIFRGRDVEYFSEPDDAAAVERALALIAAGAHDLLLVYNQEYDDMLHAGTPWTPQALAAGGHHVKNFRRLAEAFEARWAGLPRGEAFLPDHGAHVDKATGKGAHGADMPADMNLLHFWRFSA